MFEHSIKVPRLYTVAAKIAENVSSNGASVKTLVYEKKHCNTKALFALVATTLQQSSQLDFLFKRTKLLEKEPRLNPWLARVLVTELIWGKKRLASECKPVKTILAYQQILNAHATDVYEDQPVDTKVVKPRFVRVNTILTSVKDVIDDFRDEGWIFVRHTETKDYDGFLEKISNLATDEFMVDIHIPELLIFPPNAQFYSHQANRNGLIILQDKASCLPVHLLNPPPGSTVLDMCAAPGMKTSQLAAKLNNNGKVYAVDLDTARLKTLENLMESVGATCVETINKDVLKIRNKEYPNIEYILVDPSCSGSGIVNRLDITKNSVKNENRIKKLQGFQIMILKHALRGFENAKRVIYSTCSIYPEENEEVIKEVLPQISKYKLVPAANFLNSPWYNFGSEKYGDIGKFCLYSKYDTDLTNGFFVAVFERLNDGEKNVYFNQTNITKHKNVKVTANICNKNDSKNLSKKRKHEKEKKSCDSKTEDEVIINNSCQENSYREVPTETEIHISPKKKKKNKHMCSDIAENALGVNNKNNNQTSQENDEINTKERSKKHKKKSPNDRSNISSNGNYLDSVVENIEIAAGTKDKYDCSIETNNENIKKNAEEETSYNLNNDNMPENSEAIKEKVKKMKHKKNNSYTLENRENKNAEITDPNDGIVLEASEEPTETHMKKKKHKRKALDTPNDRENESKSVSSDNSNVHIENNIKKKCKTKNRDEDMNFVEDTVIKDTEENLSDHIAIANDQRNSKLLKDDNYSKKQHKRKHIKDISNCDQLKYVVDEDNINMLNCSGIDQVNSDSKIENIKEKTHKKKKGCKVSDKNKCEEDIELNNINNDAIIKNSDERQRKEEKRSSRSNSDINDINSEMHPGKPTEKTYTKKKDCKLSDEDKCEEDIELNNINTVIIINTLTINNDAIIKKSDKRQRKKEKRSSRSNSDITEMNSGKPTEETHTKKKDCNLSDEDKCEKGIELNNINNDAIIKKSDERQRKKENRSSSSNFDINDINSEMHAGKPTVEKIDGTNITEESLNQEELPNIFDLLNEYITTKLTKNKDISNLVDASEANHVSKKKKSKHRQWYPQ